MSAVTEKPTQGLDLKKTLALFEEGGHLSRTIKGFEPRLQQRQMAENVLEAYQYHRISLIEAGTGTGKSMAYLVPALLFAAKYQEKTVISTHTITLQEQLIQKDIPHLLKALNLQLKAVLVKGMNNYICLRKLEDAKTEANLFPSEETEEIKFIANIKNLREGSRSELSFVPSPKTWEKISAESDACSRNQCPYFQDCYFFKARRQVNDAQILIVNHHLLFTDLFQAAQEEKPNVQTLLPSYKRLIIDEAHHIEDVATELFADRISRFELLAILNRLTSEKNQKQEGKLVSLREKLQQIYNKTPPQEIGNVIRLMNIDLPSLRRSLNDLIAETFQEILDFIERLRDRPSDDDSSPTEKKLRILKEHQTLPKWDNEIVPYIKKLISTLSEYCQHLESIETALKLINHERLQEQTKSVRLDIKSSSLKLVQVITLLDHFITPLQDPNKVRWIEAQKFKTMTNTQLVDANLDISKLLVDFLFSKIPTIVLCSATLTTNSSFHFIRQRLGLQSSLLPQQTITEHIYDSPFDYQKQALLAIPTDLFSPSHPDFLKKAYEHILRAIQASRGNAFILFTSYMMLQNCYEMLQNPLREQGYHLLKQGDEQRQTLLSKFKKTDRSILFGTDSFWEGVDVAGDALRCVIIVKLPFKVPTDPLTQARTEAILARKGDPFFEYSIPHAIMKFKQGFGRLIRQKWDRGCVVCLDVRLITKPYGKLFLDSVPACERIFLAGPALQQKMDDFYRKTYYLAKNSPYSQLK